MIPEKYAENPALFKLALYCQGLRISKDAKQALTLGREIMRVRAGPGSGLELVLPAGLWTNVPVSENFCAGSPFELFYQAPRFLIRHENGEVIPVKPAPRHRWYGQDCASGKPMRHVGTLQGTYLGIFPTKVCEFWTNAAKENCKYCSVGLNLGVDDAPQKTIGEVLEVVRAARRESNITYVDFNTGHHEDESFLDAVEPLVKAVKRETGLLVGIQTPPHSDLSRYDRLREMGVNRVSFCFELYDRQRFEEVCPGKHRFYGLDRFLKTIEYCASLGKKQRILESWVTNGEVIAGLEAPESTIAAIEHLASVGAIPTVFVFRPLKGTRYSRLPPPKSEAMIPVFRHLYEACIKYGLPIALAPNLHVSLVMLPEECSWLSPLPRTTAFRLKTMKLQFKKTLFRSLFWLKLKKFDQGLTSASTAT